MQLNCPATGPPVSWLEDYGYSRNCTACSHIELYGTRANKEHSQVCKTRYETWIKQHASAELRMPSIRESRGVRGSDELHGAHDEGSGAFHVGDLDMYSPTEVGVQEDPPVVRDEGVEDETMRVEGERVESGENPPKESLGFEKTPGCPSCETGMDAPGIRRSKKCKRKREVLFHDDEERETKRETLPPESEQANSENVRGEKRVADVSVESLEKEIKYEETYKESLLGITASIVSGQGLSAEISFQRPLVELAACAFLLTDMLDAPSMSLELQVGSVQFDSHATNTVVSYGKHRIRVWQPSSAIDDSTMKELPGDATLEGMVKEVANLAEMGAGDLLTASEFAVSEQASSCRVNPRRWVTNEKGSGVRARIVLKDIAKNSVSARSIGISSPTIS